MLGARLLTSFVLKNKNMRNIDITPDEHYHIYNRGMHKHQIFFDDRDYARFLFLILYLQSPVVFQNIGRPVTSFVKSSAFNIDEDTVIQVVDNRNVSLLSFAIMPNHFHLIVKSLAENSIANYMHRIGTAYTNYFNTKYRHSGHILQGKYKAVHIADNDQLLYTSAYVHKNPSELPGWRNKISDYRWSSYQDYTRDNRWGELLDKELVLEQFDNLGEYREWVSQTTAKELKEFEEIEEFVREQNVKSRALNI